MRIFVTKPFARFADREAIDEGELRDAVARASSGLIDADLGGGVIKLRLARCGQFRAAALAIFVYGFAKKDQDNISAAELRAFRLLVKEMLKMDTGQLAAAKRNRTLMELE